MLLGNRKHLGPLDRAQISAFKFCTNILKAEHLNNLVQEMNEVEEALLDEDLPEPEKILANLLKNELEAQLQDFLGISDNGSKPKIHKISQPKI